MKIIRIYNAQNVINKTSFDMSVNANGTKTDNIVHHNGKERGDCFLDIECVLWDLSHCPKNTAPLLTLSHMH